MELLNFHECVSKRIKLAKAPRSNFFMYMITGLNEKLKGFYAFESELSLRLLLICS